MKKYCVFVLCMIINASAFLFLDGETNTSRHKLQTLEGVMPNIPSCAWSKALGDVPVSAASSQPERGVPLGGLGSGSVEWTYCGNFKHWELDAGAHNSDSSWNDAFHYYEKLPGQTPVTKTLSTLNIKSGWTYMSANSGMYYGLYPKGWTVYNASALGVNLNIECEHFSPIIKDNYRETSYPVAIFLWRFHNPTTSSIDSALMLTWENWVPHHNQPYGGFLNTFKNEQNLYGVVMKRTTGTVETKNTEYCIGTNSLPGTTVTHLTSWNKDGDGSDVYNDFKTDGILSNGTLDLSHSAAAIAIKFSLQPGASMEIPFVIAWDFPVIKFRDVAGDGTEWWRYYTKWFDRSSANSWTIAKSGLCNYTRWLSAVNRWMDEILNDQKYPDWLKGALFNEMYYLAQGGTFWEDGLKYHATEPTEYRGLHVDDNKFGYLETQIYNCYMSFDVDYYASWALLYLLPELRYTIMQYFADVITDPANPTGECPHDAGSPMYNNFIFYKGYDPFFSSNAYGVTNWKDTTAKFVAMVYRDYIVTRNISYVTYCWDAVKRAMLFINSTTKADGLPVHTNGMFPPYDTTYDAWPFNGISTYCAGLTIGALKAGIEMAKLMGDDTNRTKWENWLRLAKSSLIKKLWNGNYFNLDTTSTVIMADAVAAQLYADISGLGEIFPENYLQLHLKKVFDMNVKPNPDIDGDGCGDRGAVNGRTATGAPVGNMQADEVWSGVSYYTAALMLLHGLKIEGELTAKGVVLTTWIDNTTAYWYATPEAWRENGYTPRAEQYQRPLSVWVLKWAYDFITTTQLSLHPGWNLVSLPLRPYNPDIAVILSTIRGDYDEVRYFDSATQDWKIYRPGAQQYLNTLTNLNHTIGFWLHMTRAATLTINGTIPVVSQLELKKGWNLIGYPSSVSRNVSALKAAVPEIDIVQGFDATAKYFLKTLANDEQLSSKNGYWVHVRKDVVLTIGW